MKQILVTVGTTKFEDLIRNVDTEEFYKFLDDNNFTKLIVQKGRGEYTIKNHTNCTFKNLIVEQYELMPNFENVIKSCDYVISHAGAGIILESLKNKKHLIVVVNTTLMDNHQVELAEALEADNYVHYIKNPKEIYQEMKKMVEEDKKLTEYPDFNLDVIPNIIYEMLDI